MLWVAGVLIRGGIRAGFRAWERLLAWASWPLFLAVQLGLLAAGGKSGAAFIPAPVGHLDARGQAIIHCATAVRHPALAKPGEATV